VLISVMKSSYDYGHSDRCSGPASSVRFGAGEWMAIVRQYLGKGDDCRGRSTAGPDQSIVSFERVASSEWRVGGPCHPELPKSRSGGGQRWIPRNPRFSMVGGGFLAALHPSGVSPARNDSVISAAPAPRAVRRLRMTRDSAEHSPLPYSLLATRYSLTVEGAPCLA
jgi:hypothetical protein